MEASRPHWSAAADTKVMGGKDVLPGRHLSPLSTPSSYMMSEGSDMQEQKPFALLPLAG